MNLYFGDILPFMGEMLTALGMSFGITVASFLIGGVFSVAVYAAKASPVRALSAVASGYIGLFRNTPLLVQIYLIYFGLPVFGINLDVLQASLIALSLNNAAYCAEIIRGGFSSVSKGLVEAGEALGLDAWTIFTRVSLIPALRAVYPSLVNQFVHLFLTSSIASIIGLPELMHAILEINSQTYRSIEVLAIGALLYFASGFLISFVARVAERFLFRWAVSV
ncbi:amino acid ABC transporter permease [Mycetocola sp. 2940]|uniref:amino acid ABC transporter permease n=1 Tax=Mycetocola sp. 2940 TaxID=3156452 RepID=UPI003397A4A3